MKINEFKTKIEEILEMESQVGSLDTPIHITSLGTLALIAFIDENFNKHLRGAQLGEVKSIQDLVNIIGLDSFE